MILVILNMKRKIYDKLLEWKNNINNVKPLMVLGARQVGKTYIIDEFCNREFENFISINLFDRLDIVNLYNNMELNSDQKFNYLKTLLDFDIDKENTVLFIDEIQESERLISELKYFCEKHNNIRIICAGSLLGVKLKRSNSAFPVGKVSMLTMYPMDFEEFLWAVDKEMLALEIRKCYLNNTQMIGPLHIKALEYFRYFLICGGMPESVKDFKNVSCDIMKYNSSIKTDILNSYFNDMSRYVDNGSESLKIEKTYRSIPVQLSNESNKFQFSKIDDNARSREYETPLDWLEASNLIVKSYRVSVPEIPLNGFIKKDFYKLFLSDVGLLINALDVKFSDIVTDNLSLYKGAIVENYVANHLLFNGYSLYYWQSDGKAEVDFLIYTNDGIIPVEVKAGDSVRSKSLRVYNERFKPKYAIRISARNFGFDDGIKSIPLYAVFCI